MAIFSRLDLLTRAINEYYDVSVTDKKRDFLTIEARYMFIHIALSPDFHLTVPQLTKALGLSRSAIMRAKAKWRWLSKNDRYFKSRKLDVLNLLSKIKFEG